MIMIKKSPAAAFHGRRFRYFPTAITLFALMLLAGCAQPPTRLSPAPLAVTQAEREAGLSSVAAWSFEGRLAISQAGQGGNARVQWHQQGQDFDIRLSAPITGQSWRLRRQDGLATLDGMEGGARQGDDAERLLLEATGWQIPVGAMASWVRGARAAGPSDLSYDPSGLPATLVQDGWAVEFRGWTASAMPLPQKLFARKAQASVRLVIERWGAE